MMNYRKFYLPLPAGKHCCKKRKEDVYMVTIFFEEVKYDVAYTLWKRAQMLGMKGEDKQNYEITPDDEDWIMRAMETASYNVKEKLEWAIKNNNARAASDEIKENQGQYDFVFGFDVPWLGSPNNMANCIHNYMVNYVLADWSSMAASDMLAHYQAEARKFLNRAHNEMNEVDVHKIIPNFFI